MALDKYRELSQKEKNSKREYAGNWYQNMCEDDNQELNNIIKNYKNE